MKNFKFLVHLHLFYHNQIDYFIEKLKNINSCDWDLFVTVCENNQESEQKLKELKPDVHIIKVNNIGYDVWPFIQVIRNVNLDEYDYVLKLHTKNPRNFVTCLLGYKYRDDCKYFINDYWRNQLIRALIDTPERFKKNLEILSKDSSIGMICDRSLLLDNVTFMEEYNRGLKEARKRLNIKTEYSKHCSGTMFIIKSSVLKRLQNSDINENDFDRHSESAASFTMAHVLEQTFAVLVKDDKLNIYTIPDYKLTIRYYFRKIIKNIFSIRTTYKGEIKRKVLTILGIKISIRKGNK